MSEQNFNILFSEFLNKHQLKIEGFCALIYCIGLVFMSTKIAGGSAMAGFSLTTLAIVYYLSAFVHPKSGRFVITLSNKVIGVSSAVAIVGILFYSHSGKYSAACRVRRKIE